MKATLKWGKVDKRTWRSDGPYRIERRARDQFVAINEDNEHDHLGRWGKLDLAKDACERHQRGEPEPEPEQAAKLSIALDWQETEPGSGVYHAIGGRYVCEERNNPLLTTATYHPDAAKRAIEDAVRLPDSPTTEGAQLLCEQHHAGRGIEWVTWVKDGADWFAYKDSSGYYSCQQDEDGDQWLASWSDEDDDHELGAGTLDEAQALCQVHRGKRLLLEAAKGTLPETAKALGLDVGERDTKPNNGAEAGELGEWSIPVPLTEPELAKLGQRLGELTVQLGRETLRIASAKEAAKRTVKAAEAEIQRLNELALPLAENLDTGEEYRLVRCRQHKDSDAGELYYTDPETGEELHRRAVAKGEQQELWGKTPPPADKPPSKGVHLLNELEEAIKLAFDEQTPEAIAAAGDAIDAAAAHLQGEQLKELRARHAEAAATSAGSTETDEARIPDNEQPELDWTRVRLDGHPAYRAEVPGGEYRVERQATSGPGKGLLVAFWAPTDGERVELPGQHDKVADAKAEALQHWQSRLQWPGDPASGLLVSKCGKYQLSRYMVTGPAGVMWRALHLPGQDREPVDLGDHLLPEAQAACQAHADAGRWTR